MPSAREWSARQLAIAWVVVGLVFALARWAFEAGVYEATIEGHRVVIVSGLWPADFAAALTTAVGFLGFAVVSWLTYTWFSGARDRRRMSNMVGGPHRRPLM
ncbi:MAG: hypothetical protein R3253_12780 [Longimicrobiales bacterium]|nr:hypothetical protein [Longimicrobiales bacterium]